MTCYSDRTRETVPVNKGARVPKVPDGYVLLYKNNNYSNTTKPCVVLVKKGDVKWVK
jgi:hypothetical protein